jgi:hypothetical protein
LLGKVYKSVEEEKEELRKRLKELEEGEENSLKENMDRAIKVSKNLSQFTTGSYLLPTVCGSNLLKFFTCQMFVLYSTPIYLPPLRFRGVGGCWDRTQDSCDFGIGCQKL